MDPAWGRARSLEDLCALGRRFLAGEPVGFPGWLPGELDEESDELAPVLDALQEAGLLTLASQPAGPEETGADGRTERRRAFVLGFAAQALATGLVEACRDAGLLGRHFAALDSGPGPEPWPLAERGDQPFLLAGDPQGPAELRLFAEALGEGPALEALRAARYVVLADPQWGRPDELWRVLQGALGEAPR